MRSSHGNFAIIIVSAALVGYMRGESMRMLFLAFYIIALPWFTFCCLVLWFLKSKLSALSFYDHLFDQL
jgi:hypothetical protein